MLLTRSYTYQNACISVATSSSSINSSHPVGYSSIAEALELLKQLLSSPFTQQTIQQAKETLTHHIPKPHYPITTSRSTPRPTTVNATQASDPTSEFYLCSPKTPTNLRSLVLQKAFEKGRYLRWQKWHDEQLEVLQQELNKLARRKIFKKRLQRHPWVEGENKETMCLGKGEEMEDRMWRKEMSPSVQR